MYRPGSGTVRQTRYQGMGNRPPDPHDIISMHSGSEEAQRKAQFAHLQALLKDAIRDEEDAIKKYTYLLLEVTKYIDSFGVGRGYAELEIVTHIRLQESAHKALLERLLMKM